MRHAPLALAALVALGVAGCSPAAQPTVTQTVTAPASTASSPAAASAPTTTSTPTPSTAAPTPTTTTVAATPPSSSAQATGSVPPLTQHYCTKLQRLCFNYPAGYRIESAPVAKGEGGQVVDPQGQAVLYFLDGVGGFGGSCSPEAEVTSTVLTSVPSQIKGLQEDSIHAATANAVQVVTPVLGGKGFYATQYVTSMKSYLKPGQVKDCSGMFTDLVQAGDAGGVHLGMYGFPSNVSDRRVYATQEDARAALQTPRFQLAEAILLTASVG